MSLDCFFTLMASQGFVEVGVAKVVVEPRMEGDIVDRGVDRGITMEDSVWLEVVVARVEVASGVEEMAMVDMIVDGVAML